MKRQGDDWRTKTRRVRQFDVWPVTRFDRKFPRFWFPSELGGFSVDGSQEYVDSRSHLRVYSPPGDGNIAWDLSHGYDVFVPRDESKGLYIDHLLKWIELHRNSKFPSSSHDADLCKDNDDISMYVCKKVCIICAELLFIGLYHVVI